nr:FeFe-hydrogenase 7 [Spironucleus salmonicida]|eukprot:EST44084.1 [FeFe]-hydrogenase 7 [Spironucleus salmonicida]
MLQNPTYQTPALQINFNKCISCQNCVDLCEFSILKTCDNSFPLVQETRNQKKQMRISLNTSDCISCGQCVIACPTQAISINQSILKLDKTKINIAILSPAVLIAVQEKFGEKFIFSHLITFLKQHNFELFFDASYGVDLVIKEEVNMVIAAKKAQKFIIGSQCSGVCQLIEKQFPQYLTNLSTVKNQYNALSSYIKHVYSQKMQMDPDKFFIVHFTPCLVEKEFKFRKDISKDVDLVISTVELLEFMDQNNFVNTKDINDQFTQNFNSISKFAKQFQVPGYYTELLARQIFSSYSESFDMSQINISSLQKYDRFNQSIKLLSFTSGNFFFTFVIANGAKAVLDVFQMIKNGKLSPDFVECLICNTGCCNGGGMPQKFSFIDIVHRSQQLMANTKLVKTNEDKNPDIEEFYQSSDVQIIKQNYIPYSD